MATSSCCERSASADRRSSNPNSARAGGGPYVHCCSVNRETRLLPSLQLDQPSVPPMASCPLLTSLKFIQNEILPKQAELMGLMLQELILTKLSLNGETIFSWTIQCAPFQYSTFKLLCIRCIYTEIVDVIKKYIISCASSPENKSVHTY